MEKKNVGRRQKYMIGRWEEKNKRKMLGRDGGKELQGQRGARKIQGERCNEYGDVKIQK